MTAELDDRERPRPKLTPTSSGLGRRTFLLNVGAAALGASALPRLLRGSGATHPNIVLLVGAFMGYADIEPYGARDIHTPNLVRLASKGVRLTDAYASSSICTPSRAALLTGRYHERFGVEQIIGVDPGAKSLPRAERTIAEDLKGAGYSTAMIGKWHLGFGAESGPSAHGFDQSLAFYDWSIDYFSHREPTGKPGLYENDRAVAIDGYTTDIFSDRAAAFIAGSGAAPFFLYVAYNAALPPAQPPNHPTDVRATGPTPVRGDRWHAYTRKDYAGTIEAMDAGIGRVLDAVERKGISRNTMSVYVHDHGGRVGFSHEAPLRGNAGSVQEGGIRVPCIVSWPGELPMGVVSHQPSILMDIAVTIDSAAGAAGSLRTDGIDLLPILRGLSPQTQRAFFWRQRFWPEEDKSIMVRAVRRGRWKYIEMGMEDGSLYDLQADVAERHNRAKQHPEVVKALRELLAKWESEMPPYPEAGG